MKYRITAVVLLILALALAALVAAQTSSTGSSGTASGPQGANGSAQQQTDKKRKLHLPPNFSADEAYKQNCTRCHSEVPKLDPKRTTTIMRHMRVRSNLTKDETEAILEYLKE